MNTFFRWLLDNLYALWPVRVLQPWELGLRTFAGRPGRLHLRPGVHLFVPGLGRIQRVLAAIRWIETPYQTVTTENGQAWTFALAIGYRIFDARALCLQLENDVDSALNLIQATAADEIRATAGEYRATTDYLEARVMATASQKLLSWGIMLEGVRLTSLACVRTIRLITDSAPETRAATKDEEAQ